MTEILSEENHGRIVGHEEARHRQRSGWRYNLLFGVRKNDM